MDPKTNITLWESGAIIQYLIDTYDKEKRLTYTTSPDKHYVDQYLFWQVSGQGLFCSRYSNSITGIRYG